MGKKRPPSVKKANSGMIALEHYCNDNDLIFQGPPKEDFGIDAYVEVNVDGEPQNFIVGVQVKSGPSYRRGGNGARFYVRLDSDDVGYWLASNIPVLFMYYDTDSEKLYFKDVKKAFGGEALFSECRRLEFDPGCQVMGENLKRYICDLARCSPNMMHRFEVLSSVPVLQRRGQEIKMSPRGERVSAIDRFRIGEPADRFREGLFPMMPRILGYSNDGEWVCESFPVCHAPADGFSFLIRFLHVSGHVCFYMDLVACSDPEQDPLEEDVFSFDDYTDNLEKIAEVARKLGICDPVECFLLDVDPSDTAEVDVEELRLLLGEVTFCFEVGQMQERDALCLHARSFVPVRTAMLLLERVSPIVLPSDQNEELVPENWTGLVDARRFRRIVSVCHDAKCDRVSIIIATNADNDCFGQVIFHIAHFTMKEIRMACADALR